MAVELTRARVYDPVLRVLHWINALLIVGLLASGLGALALEPGALRASLHEWHGLAGGVLVVSLFARLIWGVIGPIYARWSDLWQPHAWAQLARQWGTPHRFGHHATASLAYWVLYAMALLLAASGLILLAVSEGAGPLAAWLSWKVDLLPALQPLHEWLAWGVLGFVLLHLGALIAHPLLHGVPVAQSMITGTQYLPCKDRCD